MVTEEMRERALAALESAENTLEESAEHEAWIEQHGGRAWERQPEPEVTHHGAVVEQPQPKSESKPAATDWSGWNRWARGIARQECKAAAEVIAKATGEAIGEAESELEDKLTAAKAELETVKARYAQDLEGLKAQIEKDRDELRATAAELRRDIDRLIDRYGIPAGEHERRVN